eukprot:TRINITY_DN912_c0_g1_i1.p1 TRINITY_DN912_c0_g1~~TRINITY_DN912_c0_g1_i1.p1  ORF type:complete len:419 (-),score=189.21 TRINITY_DN912_c0_g1_i1:144-1346(-)
MADVDHSGSEEEIDDSLNNQDIVTKYKASGDIVQKALNKVISECAPGRKIVDLCKLGDDTIAELAKGVYKGNKVEKGVAFPTSISVNHCVGHNSPLASDESKLEEGDVVKIDLGAHIDGVVAVAAHTVVLNSSADPVSGKKADAICAAHFAAEAALRLLKPGNTNTQVTKMIEKIAATFKCSPVEGVLSHQLKRFIIDGNQVILNKQTTEQKVDEFQFQEGEAYGIDIVISTGDGKTKETESRTTIYKRAVDQNYQLKMKASRQLFTEIISKSPTFPFTLRALEDEKRSKLGIVECLKHDLVFPYPVLFEKPNEFVAQFKFTALLLPGGVQKLTAFDLPHVSSTFSLTDEEVLATLQSGTKKSKKKKKNKKKGEGKEAATGVVEEKKEEKEKEKEKETSS